MEDGWGRGANARIMAIGLMDGATVVARNWIDSNRDSITSGDDGDVAALIRDMFSVMAGVLDADARDRSQLN